MGCLNIVYVENRGISFGIFSDLDASFYLGILSFLISIYIIFIIKKEQKNFGKLQVYL